ncbi:helicase-associated domain-containing protein [Streptomyces pathocidini]|uniref:Helicase-associated domain-containing protein n=1 Tax=Streptomyces pathocidini TaxID=1650571 RepID=A0ABW7UT49_9ACTN|nr:helicase C-terminal domain-containing protein [Streptomyces pathocidini]
MGRERDREVRVASERRRGAAAGPRTLAEELRTRSDEELAALLRARSDLLSPVPGDLTALATRAGTRASVVRALERLDRFALQTAEALAVAADPCSYETLLGLMAGDDRAEPPAPHVVRELPRAVRTLRAQALVWGGDDRLHLVRTAREVLAPPPPGATGTSPTGLGPTVAEAAAGMSPGRFQEIITTAGLPTTHDSVTAVESLTALFRDRTRMAALLAEAPPESGEILARLVWGPPYGTVPAQPSPPVRWLTARGLLLPTAPGTVVLPREVALHLRGGRAHRTPEPVPPAVAVAAEHRPRIVDATAAGQSLTALGTVEDLLKAWENGGPAVLRAGGLSVRDLKRAAITVDTDEPTAAFWLELAYAAGLLASDGEADERFAPTPAYDEWLRSPAEARWATLVAAWLPATRTAGPVGGVDPKGRALSALGPGLDRTPAPAVRHRVLHLLAALPEGAAPDHSAVLARLRWEHGGAAHAQPSAGGVQAQPGTGGAHGQAGVGGAAMSAGPGAGGRSASGTAGARTRGAAFADRAGAARVSGTGGMTGGVGDVPAPPPDDLRSRLARWMLKEAELLGITGRGALSAHGRALLAPAAPQTAADGFGKLPGTEQEAPHATAERGQVGGRPSTSGAAGPRARGAASDDRASTGRASADRVFGAGGATGAAGDTVPVPPPQPPFSDSGARAAAVFAAAPTEPPSDGEAVVAGARAAAVLAPLLPPPLDHILLQADLTAVAPGPLERPLAQMLGVLAEVESKGGATVYRFTPGSVRRALDAGQTAADLHAFLARHSRTPVPQPLSYLIDDVARKHGHLRVGAAFAYVRCDDEALLAEILADRRSSGLRLRRLAPTVLAAQTTPDLMLERLREMGFAPAAESTEGDVLVARADAHRTPPRAAPAPVQSGPPVPDATLLGAAVKAIRAGDRAATAVTRPTTPAAAGAPASPPGSGGLPRTTSAETLATMQAAALTSSAVWIGYVNADGAASQRVIAPVRVEGGFVTAYDHTADEVRTFPLHRITGVAELADDPT